MKRRTSFTLAALLALGVNVSAYAQQTTLRVFSGGANASRISTRRARPLGVS